MSKNNFIDEEYLLLERPNIRKECNIKSNEEMNNYLAIYNVYNNLLIQFMIKKYHLLDVDKELEKRIDSFPEVPSSEKDLYQHLSEGYLKYFYLRNNIYIERLTKEQLNYLFSIYQSGNLKLNSQYEQFINDTYLKVILENENEKGVNVNYGPDNLKYYKPSNSIVIGVRYNQFQNLPNDENIFSSFASAEGQIRILTDFLEYKVKQESDIPFNVIKYDDFSVNCKKKIASISKK